VIEGFRAAVLKAPEISDVYNHYRGENLPDEQFFDNALVDNFHIPSAKLSEFKTMFTETLKQAELLEDHDGKQRVLDVSQGSISSGGSSETLKKLGKAVNISADDTCFVVMPFAPPLGHHYSLIYEPAIQKAGELSRFCVSGDNQSLSLERTNRLCHQLDPNCLMNY
jgi:hypothetical protein